MEKIDSNNVYSALKIFCHEDILPKIGKEVVAPRLIQIMPQNLCNHNCEFCSYRRSGNKNNVMFDSKSFIPREKMLEILNDSKDIGVKSFEITGGGEPTIYPYFWEMITRMVKHEFDISIVSNGSNLKDEFIDILSSRLLWARISVDSGRIEDYMKIRRVTEKHWHRAWSSVAALRRRCSHPEFSLGVGYVITNDNYLGISEGVRMAKENGAHNIRISAAFTEKNLDYYKSSGFNSNTDFIKFCSHTANESKIKYEDENFKVFNLFDERVDNMASSKQDYPFCMAKEVVCIIGGDSRVYTCCSLAFNHKGFVGDLSNRSFKDLWFSPETKAFFSNHDPRTLCNIMCLYQTRNENYLKFKDKDPKEVLAGVKLKHVNFI